MSIVTGPYARAIRSDPNRYQEGLYSLAQTVERILTYAFFFKRLQDQLSQENISGIDYEQARFSLYAYFDKIVTDLQTLVEQKRSSWNFNQLEIEWKKYEHNEQKLSNVSSAIENLKKKLKSLGDYRHQRVGHHSKNVKMTDLTGLPGKIEHLQDIVNLLDMFVSSPIPYFLYVHDTSVFPPKTMEKLNLRELLELT